MNLNLIFTSNISDTHAPEGFNEFYNQRRRWVPSTMANIFDLLSDAKITKVNNNISSLYVFYQSILMFGTFIGPGTIFLMMVSAIQAVFAVDIYSSFIWNFIPLSIFMTICFFCKQKYQLTAAFIISVLYSLIMMAVMVGVAIQVMTEGIFAPSSSFFFIVALQVIITGLLHPQEIKALPAGIIYYITIPCMYMLLIIYSLFNLNDVSWGTRENPQDAVKVEENKKQTKLQKVLGYLRPNNDDEDDGSFEFSFAGLFRCILCTHKKTDTVGIQLNSIENSLSYLTDKISNLEKKMNQESSPIMDNNNDDDEIESDDEFEEIPLMENETKNLLPDWLYDPDLMDGETDTIPASEEQFWVDLIEKYLTPLDMTSKDKEQMQNQLKILRDISVFAFTMGNALFVLINLLLQLNKEYLQMKWPFNVKNVITFDGSSMEIQIERDYLHLEPISLLFVAFFGVVLFVQFIAMLFHRFATISQILATTTIDWYCGRRVKDTVTSSELREKAVEIARYLQKPRPEWNDDDDDNSSVNKKIRQDTLHRLLMQHKKKKDWSNLEMNFKREFFKETDLKLRNLKLCRRTMSILDEIRKSTAEYRKIKKSSNYNVSNYYPHSEGAYSNVNSYNSTVDSFSLYQKASYQAPSSTQSVQFNIVNRNPQLRSALKRPKSQPTFNLNDDFSIYGESGSGRENYGFENEDKSEDEEEIYDIREDMKKENEKDTSI